MMKKMDDTQEEEESHAHIRSSRPITQFLTLTSPPGFNINVARLGSAETLPSGAGDGARVTGGG